MCSRRSASIRWKCIGWIGSRRSFSLRECATTPRVRSGRASAFLGMERGLDDSVFARLRLLVGSLFLERLSGLLQHGLTRRFIGHHWSLDWEPERSRCLYGTPHPARTPHRRSTLHDHWWRRYVSLRGGVSHLRKIVADMPDPGKENLPHLQLGR